MSRHRNIFKKAKVLIQKLFSTSIDFDNKLVIDEFGNNASLVYIRSYWNVKDTRTLTLSNPVNSNSDFTMIMAFAFGETPTNSNKYLFGTNTQISIQHTTTNSYRLSINGVSRFNIVPSTATLINTIYLYTFKREGNIFKFFRDAELIGSFDATGITVSQNILNFGAQGSNDNFYIYNAAIFTDSRPDVDIQSLNKYNYSLYNYAVLHNTISRFWHFDSISIPATPDFFYCLITGESLATEGTRGAGGSTLGFIPNFELKVGFDLYTLNASPFTRLYIPIKYDGISFNKVIAGYTFVETVTQSDNDFLNCETNILQPDIQTLKDADINFFYFNNLGVPLEKSFSDVYNETLDYIEADKTSNKITNLKLYV